MLSVLKVDAEANRAASVQEVGVSAECICIDRGGIDKCRQMSQTNADKRFCICRQTQTHITDKCRQMHDKCSKPEAEIQQDGICQACWFGERCMHVLAVVLDSTICGVCCVWVCTTVKQQKIKRKTEKTLEKSECLL